MKMRLLCFILILVMMFGATAPCFGADDVNVISFKSGTNVLNAYSAITSIISYLANWEILWQNWATLTGSGGTPSTYYSFQDLASDFHNFISWLTPSGSINSSSSITDLTLYELIDYIGWNISQTWGNWESIWSDTASNTYSIVGNTGSIVTNTDDLEKSLTNYFRDAQTVNVANRKLNMHSDLVNSALTYPVRNLGSGFTYTEDRYSWLNGSPLGNIALILDKLNNNFVIASQMDYDAMFDNASPTTRLSVWDSQQDAITQEYWYPDSGMNGLYKYLAYLQRDVARMTYIIADPHEQQAMENANDSGVSSVYADLYDADNGGVTLDSLTDTFSAGTGASQAFDTGVSFSANGLFSFTDDGNWGFWSNAVKNDMDNVPQTREVYDMSAYNDQMESLSKIWGIDNDK